MLDNEEYGILCNDTAIGDALTYAPVGGDRDGCC